MFYNGWRLGGRFNAAKPLLAVRAFVKRINLNKWKK